MKDSVDSVNWSSVSQAYDPSQVDKPQNPRGLEQTNSEQPRLSRSTSASSMDSTDESSSERDIRSLAEARQGLRDAAKAKMSFGRFKNAVLSKLPFVGKTTYGKIMDRAAAVRELERPDFAELEAEEEMVTPGLGRPGEEAFIIRG